MYCLLFWNLKIFSALWCLVHPPSLQEHRTTFLCPCTLGHPETCLVFFHTLRIFPPHSSSFITSLIILLKAWRRDHASRKNVLSPGFSQMPLPVSAVGLKSVALLHLSWGCVSGAETAQMLLWGFGGYKQGPQSSLDPLSGPVSFNSIINTELLILIFFSDMKYLSSPDLRGYARVVN